MKDGGFEPVVKEGGFLRPRCCALVRLAVFNMHLQLILIFLKQSLIMHPRLALNLPSS